MGQPETNPKPVPETKIYADKERPDVTKERYFRCSVTTHPDEGAWIYLHDTIHTPIRFHRDYEIILPEWAVNALRNTTIRQMVARFAPFQKSVPYVPKITKRFHPEVLEEVTYADYVAFRDNDAAKPLPTSGDAPVIN